MDDFETDEDFSPNKKGSEPSSDSNNESSSENLHDSVPENDNSTNNLEEQFDNEDRGNLSEDAESDSSEEMKNFFTATRSGFKKVAGDVKRVTRLDFEDYHRRRHLESFAKSMDQWSEFEKKFELKEGVTPQDFTFSRLNFDRYRDTLLNIDVKEMTQLDKFLFDLIDSYYDDMQNEDLNVVMSKLRRKYKLAPSKREIFERLESLQCLTLDQDNRVEDEVDNRKPEHNNANGKHESDNQTVTLDYEGDETPSKKLMVGSKLKHLLRNKAIRSNSGVVVITVMTSPGTFSCSENCYYCPNEPGQPRSYLSTEPAVLRANQNDFDAVKQFYDRANTLYKNGHVVDKIEIIVLGGTWSGYPRSYQEEFIRDLFYAANVYPENLQKCRERGTIDYEQTLNENSKCRIIGLTLETRPDRINPTEIELLRRFGCTRVQLGIQHTNDSILEYVNRGHTTQDSIKAIYLLKENCFKVDIHIMPDLPSSNPQEDLEMFKYILSSKDLQVDQWKIYPCEVTPFSEIEKWHKEGKYIPYFDVDSNLLTNLIIRVKRAVHPWIRLNRVIRDIPNPSIIAGTNLTNMRQLIHNQMKKLGLVCNCIRCREVKESSIGIPVLIVREYETKGGTEYFLSYENESRSIIYGFLRLRISNNRTYDKKITKFKSLIGSGLIRELHVYGIVVAHGEKLDVNEPSQHRGIGSNLILAAEIITAYRGLWKMAIIAGIGTREYYKKHGYGLEETFMTKHLSSQDISERYENAKLRQIQVPEDITVELINLENATKVLNMSVPASRGELIDPELEENKKYDINVSYLLELAKYNSDFPIDYSKMDMFEKFILNGRILKDKVKNMIVEHPFVFLSVSFCAATVYFSRSRAGRR
ncbi:radical SAM enzyme/protein acetyltransferase ELP3 family protein [Theileria parva strain Muguga]|uniref:radical SAM enzyme/protein acetyltransferase ELP3 family protein n=1 Tax=Theileria parva strain Muguga TaxID=333668 RepID=UPI001C61CD39|nr:radical SAM enzyme/protein acetyltransferase ELP3 family protein [Theileria parva strain Muguga]KAF5153587.1 radical SAM enzyme/protein acetyltransferase ELP3 family protein [Theileria parva strain Muguga]